MPDLPKDGRPPMVLAVGWVSRITTVSLEMVLPAMLGFWLDRRWETGPWLVSLGAVLGFSVAMKHLLQMTGRASEPDDSKRRDNGF